MASGSIDWTGATMDQLGQLTPDQSGHLRTLDSRSWAQELSAVVLGRPAHAVFLSVWACLWSSSTSSGVTLTQARKLFDKNDATETIRAFAIDHGVAPHPLTLVRLLQNKGPSWEIDYALGPDPAICYVLHSCRVLGDCFRFSRCFCLQGLRGRQAIQDGELGGPGGGCTYAMATRCLRGECWPDAEGVVSRPLVTHRSGMVGTSGAGALRNNRAWGPRAM